MKRLGLGIKLGYCSAVIFLVLSFSQTAQAQNKETFGYTTLNLPTNVAPASQSIDSMYRFILYLTVATFIGVGGAMLYFIIKYRYKEGRRVKFIHGNNRLELFWTLVPTIIMALIAAFSQSIWAQHKYIDQMPQGEKVVNVHVVGRQFKWFFHYPGADGVFGKTSILWRQNTGDPAEEMGLMRGDVYDFMDEEVIEAIEKDPQRAWELEADPAGADDVFTSSMTIPVNRKVHVYLSSLDVLHSFFLPYFRVKQDAVPGLTGEIWFETDQLSADIMGRDKAGNPKPYDIICAELCGGQHYTMRGMLYAVTEQEYQDWLESNAPEIEEDEDEDEE